jgi:hypothetical protein
MGKKGSSLKTAVAALAAVVMRASPPSTAASTSTLRSWLALPVWPQLSPISRAA